MLLDRCRVPDVETFPTLRSVCFIRRQQLGYHWCTDVQKALCTHSHHIEHPRSWTTPLVAIVNQKGGTGKTSSLCDIRKSGFVRVPEGVASIASAVLFNRCRVTGVETFPTCAACALFGDGNPGIIGAQMCNWPFAQKAIISSTPELNHAGCCGPESEGRHWQDHLLVRNQEVRFPPHVPRESRPADQQCSSTDAGCRVPGAGRRNFPHLAQRVLYPATATRVPLVHRCAKGPLHT